jgi:hypothetical protein
MTYLFLGFGSAVLFALGAATVYGSDALMLQDWVDYVFWALILAGFALAAIENLRPAWCRLCERMSASVAFCRNAPCGNSAA